MRITVTAFAAAEKIKTKEINVGERCSYLPYCVKLGENQWAVIYKFGGVVCFGLNDLETKELFDEITPAFVEPLSNIESETLLLEIGSENDRLEDDSLFLKELDIEHVLMIADIMGKCVMLSRYEYDITNVFTKIEPLAAKMVNGKIKFSGKELLKQTGAVILIKQKMVGGVEVREKPEVLWENPELEKIYLKLEDEYEIIERSLALDKKLELINDSTNSQLELLHNKHSLRVEWYIVILIVVEICLTLYEMFIAK